MSRTAEGTGHPIAFPRRHAQLLEDQHTDVQAAQALQQARANLFKVALKRTG